MLSATTGVIRSGVVFSSFACGLSSGAGVVSAFDQGLSLIFQYPQFGIVQHDLLFAIMLKLYGGNGIMRRSFHLQHFAKTKFLMLHLLTRLQIAGIAGYKIAGWL